LSSWTLSLLYQIAVPELPFEWGTVIFDLNPDWHVFLATSALCGLAAALVGLAPALQARQVQLTDALRGSIAIAGRRVAPPRARAILVNAQVAISVALIIAAGLLAKAAMRAEALDLGFSARGVLLTSYDLTRHQYSAARTAAFNRTLLERAKQAPHVVSASLASHVALTGGVRVTRAWSPDAGGVDRDQHTRYVIAARGYFQTLGIHLARGRDLPAIDRGSRAAEAVVSEVLANRLWPGGDAIGKRIQTALSSREYTVVGVARDTRAASIWRDKEAALYLAPLNDEDIAQTRLVALTAGGYETPMREIRRMARGLEPDATFTVRRLEDAVALWILPSRAAAGLSGCVGLMALLIAAFGAYGVMRHVLAQQTRELGIRHALGADAGRLARFGVRQGIPLVVPGLALGLLSGHLIGRALSAALHGLTGVDPMAYIAGTTLVCLASLLACYLPARRVAALDPMTVLRTE
jgi:predicted permease